MSKRKLSLRRLFSNTKFLIVFSIVLAFIFWIVVALEYAPIIDNVVENVPVKIDIENSVPDKLGLQLFGNTDFTVDVTVRGNRYDIGGDLISADDFDVIAQTAYVNSSGNHTLNVKASVKDADADYEIVGLSSEYIEVYFDRYEEKEIEVSAELVTELSDITDAEYLFDENDIIFSTKTVLVSGAKTEVDKVIGAKLEVAIEEKLTESVTLDAQIKLLSSTTDELKHVKINNEFELTVPVTLPVYKIQTLPVSVSFKNSPSEYLNKPFEYTTTPESVKVAVMQNGSNNDETLEVGTIDFNEITETNSVFVFNASELVDVKVLDGTESFKVKLDTAGILSKMIKADNANITASGADSNVTIDITIENSGNINVCGPKDSLVNISDKDISGTIDLSDVELSSKGNRVPVNISVNNFNDCWATGTYYAFVKTK